MFIAIPCLKCTVCYILHGARVKPPWRSSVESENLHILPCKIDTSDRVRVVLLLARSPSPVPFGSSFAAHSPSNLLPPSLRLQFFSHIRDENRFAHTRNTI